MSKTVVITDKELYQSAYKYFGDRVELILSSCKGISETDKKVDILVLNNFYGNVETLPQSNVVLNIHPSLLPAFDCENAVEETFRAGVKVGGITVQNFKTKQILAQYPVLIGVDTHIDDYLNELTEISKKIIAPVIDSILQDKVFDFNDLFQSRCSQDGCGGCH